MWHKETMQMRAPLAFLLLHRKVVVTAHKIVEDLDGEVVGTLTMMERQKEPGLKAVGEGKKILSSHW
jgi:hypothetical protein